MIRWLFAGLLILLSSGSFASVSFELLVERSRALHLAEHPEWRKLNYYSSRWFGQDKSLIPPSNFFLSPKGHEDPEEELEATLKGLIDPDERLQLNIQPPVSLHAQCTHPARFQWLKQKLNFSGVREMTCARLNGFLDDLDSDRVSLVFSSGFLGNPASAMGHTLFRFHKRSNRSPLLDHAVGFGATLNTKNPISLLWRGIAGGFSGFYSVQPYYEKIQEYNNAESRDLWEYELALNESQVQLMLKSVWEVGQFPMPYYYLDLNCASILFVLLDITSPEFHFADDMAMWVTPSDVTRSLNEIPGFVKNTRYIPSSLTRYLARFEQLESDEKNAFGEVLTNSWNSFNLIDSKSKARVLDAILEYVDYADKISGSKKGDRYAALRVELLHKRSTLSETPLALPEPNPSLNPAKAHGSVRIAVGPKIDQFGKGLGVNWRPTLHDIFGSIAGFSGDVEMRFFEFEARLLPYEFRLSRFSLLDIISLNAKKPHLNPLSWRLALLMEEDLGLERNFRKYARLGMGMSIKVHQVLLFALPLVDLGHSNYRNIGLHGAIGFQGGILWTPLESLRLGSSIVAVRRFGNERVDDTKLNLTAAYSLSRDSEVRLDNSWNFDGYQAFLSYAYHFWHFGS